MTTPGQPLIRQVIRGTDWSKPWPRRPIYPKNNPEITALLATPSWSVRSLLPPKENNTAVSSPTNPESEITREKLHHLLRLSALPLPKTPEQESALLSTLRSQVHFLSEIRAVDTTGVKPLVAIRDETDESREERTIGLEDMMPWLNLEEKIGRNGRVRRKKIERVKEVVDGKERLKHGRMEWSAFNLAMDTEGRRHMRTNRVGGWFVVKKNRKAEEAKMVKDAGNGG